MAAPMGTLSLRLPATTFTFKERKSKKKTAAQAHSPQNVETTPKRIQSNDEFQQKIVCVPVIVEFRRLLQSAKYNTVDIVPGVSLSACWSEPGRCAPVPGLERRRTCSLL